MSRFAPLYAAGSGSCVPTMYVGSDLTSAVHESIFHDVPLVGVKSVPESVLDEFVYSIVEPQSDLRLADLTSSGLMKINATRALTECEASGYLESVQWAQAIRSDNRGLMGLFWVSRRNNQGRAMVLFGDRIAGSILQVKHGPMSLRNFETEIHDIAARCDIDIVKR